MPAEEWLGWAGEMAGEGAERSCCRAGEKAWSCTRKYRGHDCCTMIKSFDVDRVPGLINLS